jgi:hypothetical protein
MCEEKRKRSCPRASLRFGFVSASRCQAPNSEGLPERECQGFVSLGEYINFSRASAVVPFLLHALARSSDRLACFEAQMMPRSSKTRLPVKVSRACLPRSVKWTIETTPLTTTTSPRFYACDLAPKHSQAAYLIYVSVEEKPLFMGAEIDSRVFSTLPPCLIGN